MGSPSNDASAFATPKEGLRADKKLLGCGFYGLFWLYQRALRLDGFDFYRTSRTKVRDPLARGKCYISTKATYISCTFGLASLKVRALELL